MSFIIFGALWGFVAGTLLPLFSLQWFLFIIGPVLGFLFGEFSK